MTCYYIITAGIISFKNKALPETSENFYPIRVKLYLPLSLPMKYTRSNLKVATTPAGSYKGLNFRIHSLKVYAICNKINAHINLRSIPLTTAMVSPGTI